MQDMLGHHVLSDGCRSVVAAARASVVGLLTVLRLREVPQADWPKCALKHGMIPTVRIRWVWPDMDLAAAMGEMDRDGVNQLPVMRDGTVLGMLTCGDVIDLLRSRRLAEAGSRFSRDSRTVCRRTLPSARSIHFASRCRLARS